MKGGESRGAEMSWAICRLISILLTRKLIKEREAQMDTDTLILLGLLASAFSWWFTIRVKEARQFVKQCNKDQQDREERAERVRRLTNKL